MLEVDKIKQLIEMMVANDLVEVSLRDGEREVNLRRPNAASMAPLAANLIAAPMAQAPVPAPVAASGAAGTTPSVEEAEEDFVDIASPMVGTFYTASDPESPPFVAIGTEVQVGTVVCILEAMKVFNEIKSEIAGRVERILVKNADAVEFGQALFKVRPL